MKTSDLARVLELTRQLGYEATLDDMRDRFRAVDSQPTHALFVARDETSNAVGYVHIFREQESLLNGERAQLHTLVVDTSLRRKNIGAQLLAKAEAWAKSQGLTAIRLRSNTTRNDAHRFYQKHGYDTLKTSFTFIKTLE